LNKEFPEKGNENSTPNCCNCKLKEGEQPHPSAYRGCRYAKLELQGRKNPKGPKHGEKRKIILIQQRFLRTVLRSGAQKISADSSAESCITDAINIGR
jgi:hypothetical protein